MLRDCDRFLSGFFTLHLTNSKTKNLTKMTFRSVDPSGLPRLKKFTFTDFRIRHKVNQGWRRNHRHLLSHVCGYSKRRKASKFGQVQLCLQLHALRRRLANFRPTPSKLSWTASRMLSYRIQRKGNVLQAIHKMTTKKLFSF